LPDNHCVFFAPTFVTGFSLPQVSTGSVRGGGHGHFYFAMLLIMSIKEVQANERGERGESAFSQRSKGAKLCLIIQDEAVTIEKDYCQH
jgi:hypothetical protein